MNIEKYTNKGGADTKILRHIDRELITVPEHIDTTKSNKNFNCLAKRKINSVDYHKQRLSEVYIYGNGKRKDLVTLASCVVTCPKELLNNPEEIRKFFNTTINFLGEKFGGQNHKNCCSCVVHYDEVTPHIHYAFVPVCERTPTEKNPQTEKLCANDILNRQLFRTLHGEFQEYITKSGINANVNSGITREQGNRTIEQLRAESNVFKFAHNIEHER